MYIFFILISVSSSGLDEIGKITPSGSMSLYMTLTNQGEIADYVFTFTIEHHLPIGAYMNIEFPEQYLENLGSDSLKCSIGSCTVTSRVVRILLLEEMNPNKEYELVIYDVKNPSEHGGTGNFALTTFRGMNVVDRNQVFGVVGIAKMPGKLLSATVSVVSGGSTHAGDVANYQFKFRLSRSLQAWHWLRFTFPSSFNLAAYPSCSSFSIESSFIPGSLSCSSTDTSVLMAGISQDLQIGSEYGIYISATNPPHSGITGTFMIETGRNGTFTVLDRRDSIEGIYIDPGVISDISLKPYNTDWVISKNKKMLYRLKFLLKNPIDLDGYIILYFSNSFQMDYTTIQEIEYGLEDKSSTSQALLTYSLTSKTMKISNFAAFSPILISLLLEINNPSDSGPSNPISIRSYLSDSTLIDEDTTKAKIEVSIYSSPKSTSVSYPGVTVAQATGTSTIIRIHMFPQIEIPQLGYIEIYIPDGFDIIATPTCSLEPTNMLLQISPSCTFLDGILTVQLYADTVNNYGKFLSTVESFVQIDGILAPDSSGWYLFNFNTYSEVKDFLESGMATAWMVASTFTSFSVDVISAGISSPTILTIDFQTNKVIPTGVEPYITTDLQSGIEIYLPTMDASGNYLFDTKLGLGVSVGDKIPCKSMSGISSNLYCLVTYIPSTISTTENVIVTVKGYDEILSGTSVSIHISGIFYVQTASFPTITITSYKKYNRKRYDLETGQTNLNAGIAMPAATATGLSLSLSETKVNTTTTLSPSSNLPLSSSTTSGSPYLMLQIIPTHEQGYCKFSEPICYINSIAYPCECYSGSDIILISYTSDLTTTYSISISNLINPETVGTSNDGLIGYLIDSYQVIQQYTFNSIPMITSGTILKTRITLSDRGQGYANVKYVIEITPEHYLVEGGVVVITFPGEFSLDMSLPPSSCYAKYISTKTKCTVSGNEVTLTEYQSFSSIFLVYIIGVKNPIIDTTSPFTCVSYSSSGLLIDSHYNIPGVTLQGFWIEDELKYVSVDVFPSNANATADYRISLTPSKYLSAGGFIDVTFPLMQFPGLPQNPLCRVVGYVQTLKKCEAFKNILRVTLDEDPPFKIMFIDIIGVINFPAGKSSSFVVKSYYDGVLLQETKDDIIAVTTSQASTLDVKSLSFYPQNEGERATYIFEFSPKFNIPSDAYIRIVFPSSYDQRLGTSLSCYSIGLNGSLQCSVFSAYTLTIYNHESYFVCKTCSIKLYVYGVINPTYHAANEHTGQFKIGIFYNNVYTELNEYSGQCKILPAGDYADIESITHDSLDSRNIGLMSFNITTAMTIPPTNDEGAVWFTFPDDYPLLDDDFHCTSSSFWAQGVPDCHLYIDTIQANAQTEEYNGNLVISIEDLPYPLTEVYANFITVKIYDGINFKLLSRTYPNLSPNRMTYTYAGPLIIINHDEIFTVSAGTMSEFIPITLDYPCALNLTLVPYASGFTILPHKISLQTGDVYKDFRISVPSSTKNDTYFIYWTTVGEIEPLYYVVIIPTEFKVVYEKVTINIEQPVPVPRGGKSLPVYVNFPNAPDSDLTVHLKLSSESSHIYLSDDSLVFEKAEYSKTFIISVGLASSAVTDRVYFSITGSNLDSFALPFEYTDFSIFSDKDSPEVLSIELISISRTTANFTITSSKVCTCYYAYALRGSGIPEFGEVLVQGPAPYYTTQTHYGISRVIEYRQGTIFLSNLIKQTEYTLYIWLLDLSGFISSNASTLDFKTDTRYKAAEVTLYYDQTYLTHDDTSLARSTVALLLSLPDWRVVLNDGKSKTKPNNDVSPSSQSRALGTIQSYLVFNILEVDNSEVYPRPLEMVGILAEKSSHLEAILTNFYAETEIKGVEIYVDECSFVIYPNVAEVTYRNGTIRAALEQDGSIYAVLVKEDNQPFAYQVYKGLDYQNKPVVNSVAPATAGDDVYIIFNNLLPNTTYNVFLICTNAYPGYPDLLNDANLVKLTWETLPDPVLPALFVNSSFLLSIFWLFVLIF